jgi:hypothetical protein
MYQILGSEVSMLLPLKKEYPLHVTVTTRIFATDKA